MTEEGNTQEAAPEAAVQEAAPEAAVEQTIEQSKPGIMMDKEVAAEMGSNASDANTTVGGDPVEQGLSKGMKLSGVAGDKVPEATESKDDVSPIADVPVDAQLNTEGSSPSVTDTDKSEETETDAKEEVEETTEEPEAEAEEEPESSEDKTEEKTEEAEEEAKEEAKEEAEDEIPEAAQPEGEPEEEVEEEVEDTPFGDPLRNVVENQPEVRDIDRKTTEDSNILLSDVPGKLRIY